LKLIKFSTKLSKTGLINLANKTRHLSTMNFSLKTNNVPADAL